MSTPVSVDAIYCAPVLPSTTSLPPTTASSGPVEKPFVACNGVCDVVSVGNAVDAAV